jgi:hypothetical protein
MVAGTGAAAAAPPSNVSSPTITVLDEAFPDNALAQGATFKVQGTGWEPDSLIQIEVCGNEARSGTSDCATDAAQVVASNSIGVFQGRLAVVIPPKPCPCVIRAISQTSADLATTSVEIPNAPTSHPGDGDVVAPALRRLEVENVHLRGSDSWNTWLGGPARRTFEFEVVNTGTVAVVDAAVALTAGPIDNPNGFLRPVKIDRVEVGERRSFEVPVDFPALAFGDQAVRATVNGTSVPVAFKATTTTHPWLLIIIPALIIGQLLLIGTRNVLRRRLHDHDESLAPTMVPSVIGPADDSLICVVELTETIPPAVPIAPEPEETGADLAIEDFAEHLLVGGDMVRGDTVEGDDGSTDDISTDEGPGGLDPGELDPGDAAADTDGDGRVTVSELVAAAIITDPPHVQHHTMVLRSISALKQVVRESLAPPADSGRVRTINAITVLADADARVGDAHLACDDLCAWIDAEFTDAGAALTLRRRHVTAAAASGLGMVPLSVLVRTANVAA